MAGALPKVSPNRRRSIAVLNQGSTSNAAQQRRRRAYSMAPGDKLSPVTRARRIGAPRKSILKQSFNASESQDDTTMSGVDETKSLNRRVSFAAHAHVQMFNKERPLSKNRRPSESPNQPDQAGEGSAEQQQHARFADDNNQGQNHEEDNPQAGQERRKSTRRRSSTAFSEFGERSMEMDDDDEVPAPIDFLGEYLNNDAYNIDEDEDEQFDDEDDMDVTQAVDPRIIRKRSLSIAAAQFPRRRSSALPPMTSSLHHSENQPPRIEEEHTDDDDTSYCHDQDDHTTSSSGNTVSFLSNEGSSGETAPVEFTIPINQSLRKPAQEDEMWQKLRAMTHAGANNDDDQSQEMEEEPHYEPGDVIPLEDFDEEDVHHDSGAMELTTALDRLMKARASMGLPPVPPSGEGMEDSFTSSNDSFGGDGNENETINVTALMRRSTGGQSNSLMDETEIFGGPRIEYPQSQSGEESIRAPVNGQAVAEFPREPQSETDQQQSKTPPQRQSLQSSGPFSRPSIPSAPTHNPSPPAQNPSPPTQNPSPPSIPSANIHPPSPSKQAQPATTPRPFSFSRPSTSAPSAPASPAKAPSTSQPLKSPSKIPRPAFRGTAAFAPPTAPKSPKKRLAPEDQTIHDPEDRPSPSKRQATDRLQSPAKKKVAFQELPRSTLAPSVSSAPSVPANANSNAGKERRTSMGRRPPGYFAQRKSIAPGTSLSAGRTAQTKVGRASLGAAPAEGSAPISFYPDVSRIMEEDPPTPQRVATADAASSATLQTGSIAAVNDVDHAEPTPASDSAQVTSISPAQPATRSPVNVEKHASPPGPALPPSSLYPEITEDLRVDEYLKPTASTLAAIDEDTTEPINTELWRNGVQAEDVSEDEGPSISIEQFFDMTKIRFMDELAAPRHSIHPNQLATESRRRSLNTSQNGEEADDVPLSEFVSALTVDLPQLELYSTVAGELQTWIEESKKMCNEANEEAIKMTPGLFREFAESDEGEREFLLHQLKVIKAHCHGVARQQWYEWKQTWTEQLQATADEAFTNLESDAKFIESIRKETSTMLPALRAEYTQVMSELEQEQAEIAEIEQQDQDQLNELKATITEQDHIIETYTTDVSEAKAKLALLEEKLAEVEAQKQEALDAITKAHHMAHIQQESTLSEVFRLKDELEALEILHQWHLTRFDPNLAEFVYAGRYAVSIPCVDFTPVLDKFDVQRMKESLQQRDSFPRFTDMVLQEARRAVVQMPESDLRGGSTKLSGLRKLLRRLSSFWSGCSQLRRQFELLKLRYPLSMELVPEEGLPSIKATATVMIHAVKSKAFISFLVDSSILSQWPFSIKNLKTDVSVAYGRADRQLLLDAIQGRLDEASPFHNYCCLLDACIVAKQQYD